MPAQKGEIDKRVSCHTLRTQIATMLEPGTLIPRHQLMLGNDKLDTTALIPAWHQDNHES